MPRPSIFTQELAETICDRIAEGESLRRICLDSDMPDKATVLRWCDRDPQFRESYAMALEWRCDMLLDEILEIADGLNGRRLSKGGNQPPRDSTAHARLQIGVRKWLYCRLMPKKYKVSPSYATIERIIIIGEKESPISR